MKRALSAIVLASATLLFACGKPPEAPPKYPERQPGCEVRIFPERPGYPVDNIGPVSSSCDESIADAECLRTMMDQACKMGGDTIWGVSDKPELKLGKKRFYGRAAHQK